MRATTKPAGHSQGGEAQHFPNLDRAGFERLPGLPRGSLVVGSLQPALSTPGWSPRHPDTQAAHPDAVLGGVLSHAMELPTSREIELETLLRERDAQVAELTVSPSYRVHRASQDLNVTPFVIAH